MIIVERAAAPFVPKQAEQTAGSAPLLYFVVIVFHVAAEGLAGDAVVAESA